MNLTSTSRTLNLLKTTLNLININYQINLFSGLTLKNIQNFSINNRQYQPETMRHHDIGKSLYNNQHITQLDEFQSQTRPSTRNINQKQSRQVALFFKQDQQTRLQTITFLRKNGKIRELSILAKEFLFHRDINDVEWCAIQEAFIHFLTPTQDKTKIRSISKTLYALGKSKKATRNYQTPMALLLPFATHQSFTQIVTTISRMGGMSEQFLHIVQKLYWKRKQEFSALQANLINYVLAKNQRKIDTGLVQNLNSYPLRGIALMLKTYDRAEMLTSEILKKCIPAIIARKNQTNFFDLKNFINIYTKHLFLEDAKLVQYFDDSYRALARNITEDTLQQIWQYFPEAVNQNKLTISFVEQVIKSLKILKTRNKISQRTWKKLSVTFRKFQNLEIRTQLEKL